MGSLNATKAMGGPMSTRFHKGRMVRRWAVFSLAGVAIYDLRVVCKIGEQTWRTQLDQSGGRRSRATFGVVAFLATQRCPFHGARCDVVMTPPAPIWPSTRPARYSHG